jgi:hypothetical protein
MSLRDDWKAFTGATKATAASCVDLLATVGERMPGLAQLTISAGGITATVTPKPEPHAACPTCGGRK